MDLGPVFERNLIATALRGIVIAAALLAAAPSRADCVIDPGLSAVTAVFASGGRLTNRYDANAARQASLALDRIDRARLDAWIAEQRAAGLGDAVDGILDAARSVATIRRVIDTDGLAGDLRALDDAAGPNCNLPVFTGDVERRGSSTDRPVTSLVSGLPQSRGIRLPRLDGDYAVASGLGLMASIILLTAVLLFAARRLTRWYSAWIRGRSSCIIPARILFDDEAVEGVVTVLGRNACRFRAPEGPEHVRLKRLAGRIAPVLAVWDQRVPGQVLSLHDDEAGFFFDEQITVALQSQILGHSVISPYVSPMDLKEMNLKAVPRPGGPRGPYRDTPAATHALDRRKPGGTRAGAANPARRRGDRPGGKVSAR
ncbi:hypothetical protein HKCCE2091_08020 [Rhodobacterales bacterium HKCCE2091]|nr:hypothetical protein [Rhodobacterales bacterium HKCCE2091]